MRDDIHPRRLGAWLTIVAILVTASPALILEYLPMTDLPQHVAIASILQHHADPAYGFSAYYVVHWWHTPYVLPYAMAVGLAQIMSLAAAMRIVVFVSLIAFPLGIVALLRAANKPTWFALLALPFVYNRSFFWGFIAFNLAIGLALAAFAYFIASKRSPLRDVAFVVLTLASTICHIYGLALIVALVGGYAVCGGFARLRERWWGLLPIVAGIALWAWKSAASVPYGVPSSPSLATRIEQLPSSILGGYSDRSEALVLVLAFAAWGALAAPTFPVTRARIRRLDPLERLAYLSMIGNLLLYFTLPQATLTAKWIHFRHAFLACTLLPLCASYPMRGRGRFLARSLAVIAAVATMANSWLHLVVFDREARTFKPIVERLPRAPKVLSLVFDSNGQWMRTGPYMHFVAYAQAEKGGLISTTFPSLFWNLPLEMRQPSAIPATPLNFEFSLAFNDAEFGYFYDYAIVRFPGPLVPATTPQFPFEVIAESPPWYLYRRVATSR